MFNAISPLDGRYANEMAPLAAYFSEMSLFKHRLEVEIKYLLFLAELKIVREITSDEKNDLKFLIQNFSERNFLEIKNEEKIVRHDVKALEYFIRKKIKRTTLSDLTEFIHFGLTSEDVNNLAISLSLADFLHEQFLPQLNALINDLKILSDKYKKIPMLARTHGQPALGTTVGKELAVFSFRLERIKKTLPGFRFQGKLNGAVGNYSAMLFAYPKIDWIKQNREFVENLGLEFNPLTTQIESGDSHCEFFQKVELINTILVGLCQDFWRYISDGYFKLANNPQEVGSSTMPQKINPIHFENAEGNLLVANSFLNLFITRLPISRLQRDLSGSTIRRNYGVALGHTLLAYRSFLTGLKKIKPADIKMKKDLCSDWSILSEAVQIFLKRRGYTQGYESAKKLFRGVNLNEEQYKMTIEQLPINSEDKKILKNLRPEEYLGLSDYLANYERE